MTLGDQFMAPTLWLWKIIAVTWEIKKFHTLLLKYPITFADSRKILTLKSKLRIMANRLKYTFKACLCYPESSDKPRLALAQHSYFRGPCVTIAAGIVTENAGQHRGSQWSLLRIHTNILPSCKGNHPKWEQCADSTVCNHLRPVIVHRKLPVILVVLQWN